MLGLPYDSCATALNLKLNNDVRYETWIFTGAIDGGWSPYSSWSACSEPTYCLQGSKKRTRTCTNPSPANGGDECTGLSEEEKICPTPEDGCTSKELRTQRGYSYFWAQTLINLNGFLRASLGTGTQIMWFTCFETECENHVIFKSIWPSYTNCNLPVRAWVAQTSVSLHNLRTGAQVRLWHNQILLVLGDKLMVNLDAFIHWPFIFQFFTLESLSSSKT